MTSGPFLGVSGTWDGVTVTVQPSPGLVVPPRDHFGPGVVPSDYYTGALPYYGDFQLTPLATDNMFGVLTFSTPIRLFRTTARGVGEAGMALLTYANPGDAVANGGTSWVRNESGTRTVVVPDGFRVLIFRTLTITSENGSYIFGPTFRNTYFSETIDAPATAPEADLAICVPPGAGRVLSYSWPVQDLGQFGVAYYPQFRQGRLAPAPSIVETATGTSPATGNIAEHGRLAVVAEATGASSRRWRADVADTMPYSLYFPVERPGVALGSADEWRCWRVRMIARFTGVAGPIPSDLGLTVGPGANFDVRGAAQAGMTLGATNTNTIGVTVVQVNGGARTVETPLVLDAFDLTQYHVYEMRFLGATLTTEAVAQFLVDGVVALALSWGAGTKLPPPLAASGVLGYRWCVGNGGGQAFTTRLVLAQGGLQVCAGPTEDALA